MENVVLKVIQDRTSYRGEYINEPVPREDLKKIMEAGLAAPSGCNKQSCSLLCIDDENILSVLKVLPDSPVRESIPAVIFVLSKKVICYGSKSFGPQDASAAIENMLLAIESMGYASCWYEGLIVDRNNNAERLAELLGVPDDFQIICMLPVARAVESRKKVKKKSFDERACFNHFTLE